MNQVFYKSGEEPPPGPVLAGNPIAGQSRVYRVQLNGKYEIQKNVLILRELKRGPEDLSYADPQDDDSFPDTFTFNISEKTMTLTAGKEEAVGGTATTATRT